MIFIFILESEGSLAAYFECAMDCGSFRIRSKFDEERVALLESVVTLCKGEIAFDVEITALFELVTP